MLSFVELFLYIVNQVREIYLIFQYNAILFKAHWIKLTLFMFVFSMFAAWYNFTYGYGKTRRY